MAGPWEAFQPATSGAAPWTKFQGAAGPWVKHAPLASVEPPLHGMRPEAPRVAADKSAADERLWAGVKPASLKPADPLEMAASNPNLPIGARVLAAVPDALVKQGMGVLDQFNQTAQNQRAGQPVSAQDVSPAMAMLPGALETGRGGVRPPAERAPPTAPVAPPPGIARNPEGRPIVEPGKPLDFDAEFAKLTAKPDPRAAQAGQQAVAKVADRTAGTAANPKPWDAYRQAFATPEAKKAVGVQTETLKNQLAENYHGVPAKPDANQKKAMQGAVSSFAPKPAKAKNAVEAWYENVQKEGKHGEGLDLSPAVRVARAKKQGFNTDLTLYHGTGKSDFLRFDTAKNTSEPAVFLTDDPKVANAYTHKGGSPNIIAIWSKAKNPKTTDWNGETYSGSRMSKELKEAKAAGHDALFIKNMRDVGGGGKPQNQYAFFEPGNLRSKYGAAFDPKVKAKDAHLLSAAATPTHQIHEMNKAAYEAALPKDPGLKQRAIDAVNTVKAILAPQTMRGALKGDVAAASIRKNVGLMARQEAQSAAAMEPYRKLMREMPLEDQIETLKWLQKPEVAAQRQAQMGYDFRPPPDIAPLLKVFKDTMLHWRGELEKRGKTQAMGFKEEYVSQMWRDPVAARAKMQELGPKQGSSGFTKGSVIDDYEAGIKAGLVPVTTDPVEIAMRYVENVSRYLALNDVLDEAKGGQNVVTRTPEHAPIGWQELEGRAARYLGAGPGEKAYAPPGFAAVYNAYVSHTPNTPWGNILTGAQRVANSTSAFQLGLSAFHLTNIAGEAGVSGVANAIDELAGGHPMRAGLALAAAPLKPVTSIRRGMQMRDAYINDVGSPELKKVVKLASEANFRVAGKGRAADEYRFTGHGSLFTSMRKGLLKAEAKDALAGIKASPAVGTVKAVANLAARSLETLTQPLFDFYIPMIKNGAFHDMVATWLHAHPQASEAEQVAFARQAADIMDNRFGEMNQDNIFWQRRQKQLAQTAFLSYSYTLGTARLAGGAGLDALAAPGKALKGKNPWTENLSYAIALPITIGTIGAAYQWARTGKGPTSVNDLFAPQTGGTTPSGQPERARIPSYMGTFFGMIDDPVGELSNKLNPVLRGVWEALHNQDWRGDPIAAHADPMLEKMKKYLDFAASQWEPIAMQPSNQIQPNSKINRGERFMGVQPQGMRATDPQGFKKMMERKEHNEDAVGAMHAENAKRAAKGLPPLRGHAASNFIRHWTPAYKGTQ